MQGGAGVYEVTSRAEHSCIPNCEAVHTDATGFLMILRTIRPVKIGEKLTRATGLLRRRTEPTHVRRKALLQGKDFTCRCSRCEAEGDDTCEFDCFDHHCPGSRFACQPLNKEPFVGDLPMQYTGVEYVEPHLLPCTVCHRAPPLKYQQDMFALEKRIPGLITICGLEGIPESMIAMVDPMPCTVPVSSPLTGPQAGGSIEDHVPRNHVLVLDSAHRIFEYLAASVNVRKKNFHQLESFAREYARLVEHTSYWRIAHWLILCEQRTPTMLEIAKDCGERAVRTQLMISGRECRDKSLDDTLAKVLQCLPPQPATTAQCMFCGESPLRAALTLSRCGRCKQVAYCSAGCQKAHWPVHKAVCKK